MSDIKILIDLAVKLLNTKLTFAPFSFTIMQALVGTLCLGLVIFFVRKFFDL